MDLILLLLHLIDGGAKDPLEDLFVVEKELAAYGHGLEEKPRLIVLNKQELLDQSEQKNVRNLLSDLTGQDVIIISAVMGLGLDLLMRKIWTELEL